MSAFMQSETIRQLQARVNKLSKEAKLRGDMIRKQASALHAAEIEKAFRQSDYRPSFPPDPKFKIDLRSRDAVLCRVLECEFSVDL